MNTTTSTTHSSAFTAPAMRSASASNATNSPSKEDDQAGSPAKRPQTCFRCRQSKVKCVFEGDTATMCRRCLRLGVTCELQGKKEPLSWQMRVQHQLAALEGSLQSFLEKQMSASGEMGDKRGDLGRSRDSYGGSKKRRRTIANDQRSSEVLAYGGSHSHPHTAESPLYADVHSGPASSYPSATHLSPRDAERVTDANTGLLGSLVATVAHGGSGSIAAASASLPSDHALQDDDGVTTTADQGAFSTDDEHDQASRPLSAIQKLRMSVLDRKKELSRSGERVFPNLYRLATSDVGSKDPRPNVVKQDLVSPSDAVVLFRFYADYLDQYSFGFPTYRPDAIMSPMILTSVVCVASLHHAQLNRLHTPLKKDLIARLQTDDPSFPCSDVYETLFSSSSRSSHLQSNLHFEKELDPELGIGVEEIVGASLFASWFGGKRAWMASRLARWWSAKFLRQQQHPAMMTMGEIMSILPPPRDLGKQDLLRVWLSAYITEIHQACMEGTPSIAGLSSPHAVCDSLQYAKGLSQRTTQRDRVLIIHSRIAWVLSKAYHVAGNGMEYGKADKQVSESPRACQSCRDGVEGGSAGGVGVATATATDAASCLHAVLGAFEELDSCQEEMAGRLDADAIGEAETMLYLDLFLARVLVASIGCDFLDSTLWDGSLGSISAAVHGRTSSEADLQSLRSRTLRESLTRGVEGALRSLELVCIPTLGAAAAASGSYEASLNVLVLPLWFHWALTRSVLFLMNVLAEYPERLLPRDRSRSIELINMFLDLYSKHIGHANMVLSHASGHHQSSDSANYAAPSWSPTADSNHGRDHRHGVNGAPTGNGSNGDSNGAAAATGSSTSNGAAAWQQNSASGSAGETIQHPATPLLDTLSQCLTWARHGGVM